MKDPLHSASRSIPPEVLILVCNEIPRGIKTEPSVKAWAEHLSVFLLCVGNLHSNDMLQRMDVKITEQKWKEVF